MKTSKIKGPHNYRRNIGRIIATGVLTIGNLLMLPAHSNVKKAWLGVKGVTCAT